MRTKFSGILTLILAFFVQFTFAQEKAISGTVVDENNMPLPGATVLIQGTTTGTSTDFDGKYSISANEGAVLEFSYVGYATQSITVAASNTVDVSMQPDAASLNEVVVTAHGIKREKKALGYATTSVGTEALTEKPEADVARLLQGKASGVQIQEQGGVSGSGTSIRIRGISSPTGNNDPLIVLDGIPIVSGNSGTGSSSRLSDIDPNIIENMTILKGLSATALYGSDGRNGVILITTKGAANKGGGPKKTEITFTQSLSVNEIASLPDFTSKRGRGYYDVYYTFNGNWGPDFGANNPGNGVTNGTVPHPYAASAAAVDAFPSFATDRVAYRDYAPHKNFFNTGTIRSTSISASGGTETTTFNASYSKQDDKGFIPNNFYERDNLSVSGRAQLTNKFTVTGSVNIVKTNNFTPQLAGVFTQLYQSNPSFDLNGLPYQHPVTGQMFNYDNRANNPLWMVNNTGNSQRVNRSITNISLDYKLNDWLSASYRFGYDSASESAKLHRNRGQLAAEFSNDELIGTLNSHNITNEVVNHLLLFNIDKKLNDNFRLTGNIGGNSISSRSRRTSTYSTNQLVFGNTDHQFFVDHRSESFRSQVNRPAVFGQFELDYKNMIYLSASARNEWTSNFNNNSQFYPGASLAFIPTQAFESLKGDVLGFLKLRAGYGTSAGFDAPSTYPTFTGLAVDPRTFQLGNSVFATNSVSNTAGNPNINPYLISEIELGTESQWLQNRISLDLSVYKKTTSDLIFNRQTDPATGILNFADNINEVEARGIEVDLGITPVRKDDLEWNINGIFEASRTEVTSLKESRVLYAGTSTLGNYLIEGQPLSVIMGSVVQRDSNGNLLINQSSEYIQDPNIGVIGDFNPDFITSMTNSVRWKNLNFSMLWQYQHGGDIYSGSAATLLNRGITTATDHIDSNESYILPGVLPNGAPNDVVVSAGDAYLNLYSGANEFAVWDATHIRLQELSLGYNFSNKLLEKTPFGNLSITLSGNNLWFRTVNIPKGLNIDPRSQGLGVGSNGGGFHSSTPTARRYGINIKATF